MAKKKVFTEEQEIWLKELMRKIAREVVVEMDGDDFWDHTHGKDGEME